MLYQSLVYAVVDFYSKRAVVRDTILTRSLNVEKMDRLKLEFGKIPFGSIELFDSPED